MIQRPCIQCGTLVDPPASRCKLHKIKSTGIRSHPYLHTARWEKLSKKLRKHSPFCESCNATTHLSVDHVIPVSERPDLVFVVENCRVLCATCNGRRGNRCTDDERTRVETAIAAKHARTQRFYASQQVV